VKNILYSILLVVSVLHSKTLPTEKSLIEGKLDNGFKYTIKRNPKPKNRAEFRLLINVGSLEEEDDQKGIAHFIEHMAFNGSKHFKKNELIHYFESIGVKFGSHLNANTGYERTLYKLTIPLEKDNLEKTFLVFTDWASELSFDTKEFEKERGVIVEEARSRDNLGLRLYNKSKKTTLGNSKFMNRLPIGDIDIINNISVQRAKDFYDRWYRPEFMNFVAVGDFNVTKIEILIKNHFSSLKNKSHKKRASRDIPDMNYTQVLSLTDKELTHNLLDVQYVDETIYVKTEENLRNGIIETMVYMLFNMKAKEQLLKNNPKATSIKLSVGHISSHKSSYAFSVNYQANNDLAALQELYELILSFKKYGFSKDNLALIKKHILGLNEKEYKQSSDMKSVSIASSLLKCMENSYVYVDYESKYNFKKKFIKEITLEEINQKYNKIITIENRIIRFMNTTGHQISKQNVLSSIKKAQEHLTDYSKAEKIPKKLLNKSLISKKIISQKYHPKTEINEFLLENGIKVLFKKTDFKKDKVILQGTSFGGQSLYDIKELDSARKASYFVSQSGAGKFSVLDIHKILVGKKVTASASLSGLTENVYGSADNQDIKSMFELIYLKLTQPKINKIILENRKKYLKSKLEKEEKNPKIKFNKELALFYYQNNPRIQYDTNKSIDNLNRRKMLKIFKDRFSDMNNFVFLIIGDVELKTIKSLSCKYLGNLPTKERMENFIDREKPYLEGKQKFSRAYNNENISNIMLLYKSKLSYSLRTELIFDAISSILKVRLREVIREEKSGVYGISVNTKLSKIEKNRSEISIQFSCNPKRRAELISEVNKVIAKFKENPVSNKELTIYRKKFNKEYETDMKNNYYWLSKMIYSARDNNMSLDDIFELPKILSEISADEIQDMVNKIFMKNVLQVELNPKESKER